MMNISSTPLLVVAVLGLLGWAANHLQREGLLDSSGRNALWGLLAALFGFALLAAWLGLSGVSTSAAFLAAWPTWWYPFLPVVLLVSAALLSSTVVTGLRALADRFETGLLMRLHLLRLLALGSLIKAMLGEFPLSFALAVAIPDLLFGLSAVVMVRRAAHGRVSARALLVWNALGAAVILVPTLLLTPWFMQDPLFWRLFAFPMVLAPGLIVPLLVALNLMVVWRLLERGLQPIDGATTPDDRPAGDSQAAFAPDQSITLEKP